MRVSVVVCTHNRSGLLPRLLRCLQRQFGTIEGEILVVDNRSSDDTASVVQEVATEVPTPPIRYIYEPKQGLSHARNRGASASEGDIVVYIDDDALPSDGWLCEHVRMYEQDARVGAVGGRIGLAFEQGARKPRWLSKRFHQALGEYDLGSEALIDYGEDFATPPGGNMSFRRTALEAVGPFDPSLGRTGEALLAGEEFELAWRLMRAGWRAVYNPHAVASHLVPRERLSIAYFRRRFKSNVLTSRLLSKTSLFPVTRREVLRRAAANVVVDAWRLMRVSKPGDRIYYALRIEAHSYDLALGLAELLWFPRTTAR